MPSISDSSDSHTLASASVPTLRRKSGFRSLKLRALGDELRNGMVASRLDGPMVWEDAVKGGKSGWDEETLVSSEVCQKEAATAAGFKKDEDVASPGRDGEDGDTPVNTGNQIQMETATKPVIQHLGYGVNPPSHIALAKISGYAVSIPSYVAVAGYQGYITYIPITIQPAMTLGQPTIILGHPTITLGQPTTTNGLFVQQGGRVVVCQKAGVYYH